MFCVYEVLHTTENNNNSLGKFDDGWVAFPLVWYSQPFYAPLVFWGAYDRGA